jgi:DNA polymerase-2
MLRANHYSFDKYSLNHVASKMLGKRKTIELTGRSKIKEINRLFREDKASLAVYNLQDAKLAKEIFDKSNMLSNAIERSKLSGHLLDHYGGSITAFDYVYLPRLHREGYVAGETGYI